jgi:hypothetical protein
VNKALESPTISVAAFRLASALTIVVSPILDVLWDKELLASWSSGFPRRVARVCVQRKHQSLPVEWTPPSTQTSSSCVDVLLTLAYQMSPEQTPDDPQISTLFGNRSARHFSLIRPDHASWITDKQIMLGLDPAQESTLYYKAMNLLLSGKQKINDMRTMTSCQQPKNLNISLVWS